MLAVTVVAPAGDGDIQDLGASLIRGADLLDERIQLRRDPTDREPAAAHPRQDREVLRQPDQTVGLASTRSGGSVRSPRASGNARAPDPARLSARASGVRSSWLARSTNRPSRSNASSSRSSIEFNVEPNRESSSSAGGTGRRRSSSDSEIAGSLLAHPLDRSERCARQHPPGTRHDDERDRSEQGQQQRRPADRLVAVAEVRPDHDEQRSRPPLGRDGQEPDGIVDPADRLRDEDRRGVARQLPRVRIGAAETAVVVSTIRPDGSSTWANASSGSIRSPPLAMADGS